MRKKQQIKQIEHHWLLEQAEKLRDLKEVVNLIHDDHRDLGDKVAKLRQVQEYNQRQR